ncbi:uncharacterized protein V6R79_001060 [Siganus canaliculatus]
MDDSQGFSDTIHAVIEVVFNTVSPNQMASMKQFVTEEMKLGIQQMFATIVEITVIALLQFQDLSVLSRISGPPSIVPMVTMDKVYEHLGSSISDGFSDVTGTSDDPNCSSTEKITELVAEEVTDRVNTLLSNGSNDTDLPSAAFCNRLTKMVKHVQNFLQSCASKLRHGSRQAEAEAPAQACAGNAGLEAGYSHLDFFSDPQESPENLMRAILEEQEFQSHVPKPGYMSDADYAQVMNILLEDMADSMLQDSEEYSGWDAAEESYQHLLTPWDDQELPEAPPHLFCPYLFPVETMKEEVVSASGIKEIKFVSGANNLQAAGAISKHSKKLASKIKDVCGGVSTIETAPPLQLQSPESEHSSVAQSSKTSCWRRAVRKVRTCCNFIGQAVQSLVKKMRRTKNCEQDIRTSPQELLEVSDKVTDETVVGDVVDTVDVDEVTDETVVGDVVDTVDVDEVTDETVVGDVVDTVDVDEVTDETVVGDVVDTVVVDEVTDETVVGDVVDTVVVDEVTDETVVGDEVTDTTEALVQPGYKWDRVICKVLTVTLLEQTMKKTTVNTEQHDCKDIALNLGEKLWAEMSSSVIDVEPNIDQIGKIVKAVQKDMIKDLRGWETVRSCLLSDETNDHTLIVDIIKKQLVERKKKSAFRSFLDWMRKILNLI